MVESLVRDFKGYVRFSLRNDNFFHEFIFETCNLYIYIFLHDSVISPKTINHSLPQQLVTYNFLLISLHEPSTTVLKIGISARPDLNSEKNTRKGSKR